MKRTQWPLGCLGPAMMLIGFFFMVPSNVDLAIRIIRFLISKLT